MWALILLKLNPFMLWIKLGVVTVCLAAGFWAGVRWESSALSALLLKQESLARTWQEQAHDNAVRVLDVQLNHQAEMDKQRLVIERREEIRRADAVRRTYEFWKNNVDANVIIGPAAVQLWRDNNGEPGQAGTAAPASSSTQDNAATIHDCSLSDLYANHKQLVDEYTTLSRNMAELQDWANKAVSLCNEK